MPAPDEPLMDASTRPKDTEARVGGRVAAFLDNDIVRLFVSSRVTMLAALVTAIIVLAATFAPLIAPHDPFDLRQLSLLDSHMPPAWSAEGDRRFLLGQGQFADDYEPADVLHAAVLRSSVAHGRITSLDIAPALRLLR